MLLEQRSALRDRHRDGQRLVRVLVRRVSDAQVGIARAQEIDLVELQVACGRRILRDAGHQREIALAVAHEGHDVIDVEQLDPGGRADDGQIGPPDRLDQRPVGERAARDLQDVEAVRDDAIDGGLVEGRAHGVQPVLLDPRDQAARLRAVQAGFGEPLDVLDVGPALEIRVDEGVELAELELDREGEIVAAGQGCEFVDDAEPMLDVAHVVVGELEDEQALRDQRGDRRRPRQ